MPVYQATFIFTFRQYGWTEIGYQNVADVTTALSNVQAIATARAAMLDPVVQIDSKVSDITIRGDSFYNATTIGTCVDPGCLMPALCVLVTKVSAAGRRGPLYLRGIPPGEVTNETFTPTMAFNTALENWKTTWKATMRERNVLPNPTPPPDKLVSFQTVVSMSHATNMRTHRVGRPFFLLRGRRPVR